MQQLYTFLLFFLGLTISFSSTAQTVFWFEDFDSGATTRWDVAGNHPTPAGIPGLVYGTNNNFDYFVINDANTPELSGPIVNGLNMSDQGQFVQGHHYDCPAPSNLPNPFVNTGAVNRSLHITSQAGCLGLIYAGTPGYDDWNCITISGNDFPLTQTEQYAAYNSNIDATGKCNIKLTADFFLGGSADGQEAHSTILYSIDGGTTWKIVQDNIANCLHFFAGTCNNWSRRTFELPSDADNQPDLRIAFRWTENGNTNNNTQDYALGASFNVDNVMLSSCAAPNAEFISQAGTNACKGQTCVFTSSVVTNPGVYLNCFSSLSDNCTIGAYTWNISPATFVYVGGTNANSANPQVQFTANGVYSVTMTVSTCGGTTNVVKNNLITVANCPPTANFSANNNLACAIPVAEQDIITFTDLSSTFAAPITAWSWSFSPASVTFVGGTNASSQNPQVVFNAVGNYQVTLQVTTAEGVDTEIKTAYIQAIDCDCGGGVGGPTNLYFNDFTAGAGTFTLNSAEAAPISSIAAPANRWIVDNIYTGSFGPPTPNRGGGNYLHIRSNLACSFLGGCQAIFNANSNGQRAFAKTPVINTSGSTGVSVSFWMLNASTGANGRAYVYYSINGGTTWILLATYNSIATWTFQSYTNAAFDNQPNLRFGFRFDTGTAATGAVDPAFSVDDVSVDAAGAAALPNTWAGATNGNWHTATNWSKGTVPVATDDVLIPAVAPNMPTIAAAAVAKNVCNYGTITLTGNNSLTIDADLLNEGVVQTDNVNPAADVIFANSPSKYRGSGTMYDVDVSTISSTLTLENNLTTRSFTIATTGTVDLATFTLAINKNLTKTNGTFTASNGEIHFINACPTCVDLTSNADVILNANQTFGNVIVNKTAGVKTSLLSNVTHTFTNPKILIIKSGILDANTNTVSGTGNLTMMGGEYQTAKCATVVPELTGTYALLAGKVTFDGTCNQSVKVFGTGGATTIFSENFESPNIANGNAIAGSIPVWTEAGTSALLRFNNDEGTALNGQTANVRIDWNFDPNQVETLSYGPINFGTTTTNPRLIFDFENNDNNGGFAQIRLEVLYKSTLASPWIVGATYNRTAGTVNLGNIVNLAGASSTFYIGFRVTIFDTGLGADGEVSIDNIFVTADAPAPTISYYDAEFTGTGVKTLNSGNMIIKNQLTLNLPTTLGNYVNTNTDTLYVYNNSTTAVLHTGGHIVGYLGRDVSSSAVYRFDVGSDNAGGDTYYEPITVTTNALAGPNNIVAKFYDSSPNPTTVNNVTFLTAAGRDTIKQVETEGYWHLHNNNTLLGGNYQASVSPSSYWSLSKPWAQDYYALLKQGSTTQPWDFVNGGLRSNDSTTTAFANFSNYALAFADTNIIPVTPLPITLSRFVGQKVNQANLLSWTTESELNSAYFELQRSTDAVNFTTIATIDAKGFSNSLQHYQHWDNTPSNSWNYYRLKQVDIDLSFEYSHVVALDNRREEANLLLLPNPATEEVTFDYSGVDIESSFNVEIIDVNGRVLFNKDYPTSERIRQTISLKDFPAAVYFVKFSNGKANFTRKLIVVD